MAMLVTGASGNLGRLVADRLLETHAPHDVMLTSRTPAALAVYAARGVDVRAADFSRPSTLRAAGARDFGIRRRVRVAPVVRRPSLLRPTSSRVIPSFPRLTGS